MEDAFPNPGDTLPWVEKYRPPTLKDVVSQSDIINTIERFVRNKSLPHLLFHGPPGTGKTSTIQALARQLYGEYVPYMVLEMNASDDRGIECVRETIKSFAETQPNILKGKENVNFQTKVKLIVLDEADQMTNAAQMALRRIIENFSATTRFCIICNYVNKINPALQSRCTKFRFAPLPSENVLIRIDQIAECEGIKVSAQASKTLMRVANGDMRRILNSLQSAYMSCALQQGKKGLVIIDENHILETVGLPTTVDIADLLRTLTTSSFEKAYNSIISFLRVKGYALGDIITGLYEVLVDYDFPTSTSLFFFPRLADIESRLAYGADPTVQSGDLVSVFIQIRDSLHAMLRTHNR